MDFVSSTTYNLNVMCINALGMNESCEIKVLDETERRICEFTTSSEEVASCVLPKCPAVVILVMAYDEGYPDAPAVTEMFITPALDSYSLTVMPKSDDHSQSTS